MKRAVIFFAASLCAVSLGAAEIGPVKLEKTEFSPALGQKLKIAFRTERAGKVKVEIYTSDWDTIKTIEAGPLAPGTHSVVWDGTDDDGETVPDEAYIPLFRLETPEGNFSYDPRKTGGEVLNNLDRKADMGGNITYTLPKPARTLVRVGTDNGPMLRILSDWKPRSGGKIRHRWNFKDRTGKVDFTGLHYTAAISAYALADYSIITTNNKKEDYLSYFKRKKLSCNLPKTIQAKMLERNGKRISPHYYRCRIEERTPALNLKITGAPEKNGVYILGNDKPATVILEMNNDDLALIEKKQYEVSFYVDGTFVSEAEQGYIPIRWIYKPNGLEKGDHVLTVNVTTFDGSVAAESRRFIIK